MGQSAYLLWIRSKAGRAFVDDLDDQLRPLLVHWCRAGKCGAREALRLVVDVTDGVFGDLGLPVHYRQAPPDGRLYDDRMLTDAGELLAKIVGRRVNDVTARHAETVVAALQYFAVRFWRLKLSVGVAVLGPEWLERKDVGKIWAPAGGQ